MKEMPAHERIRTLDTRLVESAKRVKILNSLTWPVELGRTFLADWRAGCPRLPHIRFDPVDSSELQRKLCEIEADCDQSDPLQRFIALTAHSYARGAAMIAAAGTSEFTRLSIELYGSPHISHGNGAPLHGLDTLAVADHLITRTRDFDRALPVTSADYCVLPSVVVEEVRRAVKDFFHSHTVEVVIDPDMAAKAAAGARTIRIRGGTCFTAADIPELIHHEAFVHTLTMLNGREQPLLKSMGLGAPRTTLTQEGLALFAEFITHSIDLSRLRRIALRLKAIYQALDGADFIDIFRFFLEHGQEEQESFYSTMRIFRGGDVRGRVVSTKDVVYLHGFLLIHTFLLKAIQAGRIHLPDMLFAGRIAVSDIALLEDAYQHGIIGPPLYEPTWIQNRPCLTAFLLHSSIVSELDLDHLTLADLLA